ncbi:MAG: hypothetical protein H0V18_18540 [Pyrinomonadaceae bacterium]|nr:hypothetical protein [Pyrinomonadaceae bacterium]
MSINIAGRRAVLAYGQWHSSDTALVELLQRFGLGALSEAHISAFKG